MSAKSESRDAGTVGVVTDTGTVGVATCTTLLVPSCLQEHASIFFTFQLLSTSLGSREVIRHVLREHNTFAVSDSQSRSEYKEKMKEIILATHLPVDNLPNCFHIVWAKILVLQVIRMLWGRETENQDDNSYHEGHREVCKRSEIIRFITHLPDINSE